MVAKEKGNISHLSRAEQREVASISCRWLDILFVTVVGILSRLYFSTITTSVGEVLPSLLCPSVTKQFPENKILRRKSAEQSDENNYKTPLQKQGYKLILLTSGL